MMIEEQSKDEGLKFLYGLTVCICTYRGHERGDIIQ